MKETKKGTILGGAMDGKMLSTAEVEAISKLPSKTNLLQKCLVLSTHRQLVLLDLSMLLCHNLQELWQQSEIQKLLKQLTTICNIANLQIT
jgi:hypothetical protein